VDNHTPSSANNNYSALAFANGVTAPVFGALAGTGNFALVDGTNAAVTLTVGGNGSNTVYSGVLSDIGSLIKTGNGTMTLSNANTYTGNTTINGGTLEIAQATIATNSTVYITNGAVLKLDFAVTNQVAGFVTNGVTAAPGVYNSTTAAPYITGPGSLLVPSLIATNPTNITLSVTGTTLNLSWPADHLGWMVQSNSVNLAVPADWQDISNTVSATNYSITIDASQTNVFYRLRSP